MRDINVSSVGADTDLIELFVQARKIIGKSLGLAIGIPILFALCGFVLAKVVPAQWEASTTMLVGKVCAGDTASPCGAFELVEPTEKTIERALGAGARVEILKKCDISEGAIDRKLFLNTHKVRLLGAPNLIEIKARGYSRQAAIKLVQLSAEEIKNSNTVAITPILSSLKRQQVRTQKTLNDINAVIAKSNKSGDGNYMPQILAIYMLDGVEVKAAAIQKQLDYIERNPVYVNEVVSTLSPVYPKAYLWAIYAFLFGCFVGIAFPLGLSLYRSVLNEK